MQVFPSVALISGERPSALEIVLFFKKVQMQSRIEPPERLKSPPSTDDDLGLRSHPVLSGF